MRLSRENKAGALVDTLSWIVTGSGRKRIYAIVLFAKCHSKYPSHGYRWLNDEIIAYGLPGKKRRSIGLFRWSFEDQMNRKNR